jgi:hypothetical protein
MNENETITRVLGYSIPLTELKHSIRLYMNWVGQIDASMGYMAVKLIDVIDMISENQDPSPDLNAMAYALVRTLVDGIVARLHEINTKDSLAVAQDFTGKLENLPTNNLHYKDFYLNLLAQGAKELNKITGIDYPPVTNSNGDIL